MFCSGYHEHDFGTRFQLNALPFCVIALYTCVSLQMRAQNQQDLIYKRGQAGVTKASVTVVFDNSDRSMSPVGLENQKQITVTRQASSVRTRAH